MCILHWCYTFCTGVTLFALVLHLNCTALSQSESNNFFIYIITRDNLRLFDNLLQSGSFRFLNHGYICVISYTPRLDTEIKAKFVRFVLTRKCLERGRVLPRSFLVKSHSNYRLDVRFQNMFYK